MNSSLYYHTLNPTRMNDLYKGFQNNKVPSEAEYQKLSVETREYQPQVLVGVRSSVCEGLTLTQASKMVMMEPLAIPAHEEQSHGRINRIGQTKETTIWSLSSSGESGVSSETHIKNIADARKIFAEEGEIWTVELEDEVGEKDEWRKEVEKGEIAGEEMI